MKVCNIKSLSLADVACIIKGNQLYKVKHTFFDDAGTPLVLDDKSFIFEG